MVIKGKEWSNAMRREGGGFNLNEECDINTQLAKLARCWGKGIEEIGWGKKYGYKPWWGMLSHNMIVHHT